MLSSIVRLSDDAAGLEKMLRLGQYVSQTGAALTLASVASPWKQAQAQFTITRRFFRLLKWYGCWAAASRWFSNQRTSPMEKMLQVSKWSFLGLFFFFEMFTITNAMKITDYDWAPAMQRESLKMWFYGIVFSIMVSLYQLFAGTDQTDEKKNRRPDLAKVYMQLAIDCADLLIPGALLAWIPVDEVYVGMAGTISTLLGGQEIWDRVQSKGPASEI